MKQGGVGPMGLSEGQQQSLGTSYVYGTLQHSDSSSVHGTYTPYLQGSSAMGIPAIQSHNINGQKDVIFPERPGQPECQYYMKTGDCKFGITCRYHHPKDRATPSPTCILSPIGLPLRPVRTLPMFIVHVRWNLILCDWLSLLCFPKYLFLKSCNELFLCMTFSPLHPVTHCSAMLDFLDDRVHHNVPSMPIMAFANLDPHANSITPQWA